MTESLAVVSFFPCQSIYQIAKLLSPPTKYSIISSSLWNEIVQDLYLTYSVFKYINYLSQYPYPEYIQPAIDEFLNFPYQFQPYSFTPLLVAQKGVSLTADEFNKLIDAITELANEFDINLKTQLSHVQRDQIVKSSKFSNVIYAINQLLTFNFNTYFLLSCSGYEFSNLLKTQNTFLNVLIGNLNVGITISDDTYVKNLLIYNSKYSITIYGSIGTIAIETDNGGIYLNNYSVLYTLNIGTDNGGVYLNNYTSANTITIQTENAGVYLKDDAYINTLYIVDNVGGVYLSNNAVIENLICKQNPGGVYISGNAKVINNQCA